MCLSHGLHHGETQSSASRISLRCEKSFKNFLLIRLADTGAVIPYPDFQLGAFATDEEVYGFSPAMTEGIVQ